jgi:hypothetical protein
LALSIWRDGRDLLRDIGAVSYPSARATTPPSSRPPTSRCISEFIRDFVESVRAAKKAGQSIDDLANSWKVPERFPKQGYLQPMPNRVKANVEVLWKELN